MLVLSHLVVVLPQWCAAAVNHSPLLISQIYSTDFSVITGQVTLTQCDGADFDQNDLGLSNSTDCGDRANSIKQLMNWDGTAYQKVNAHSMSLGVTISSHRG